MSAALATLAFLALSAAAPPPPAPDAGPPPVAAAGWCAVYTDDDAAEDRLGCDVGVGAALIQWRRAALVGLWGTESLGPGLSWTFYRPAEGPVWAVGLAVTVPWSLEDGIDIDRRSLVLGGTLSFTRAKP